jgi:long-chain fatty acid transport protein
LDFANFADGGVARYGTPWIASVGGRWSVGPALTLNAQVQRFGWSEYDAIRLALPGQSFVIEQRYRDTTSAAVGADYEVSPRLTLRGGIRRDQTPTPDDLREPGVPDSDRWVFGAGLSARLRPRLSVDAAVATTRYDDDRLSEDVPIYEGTPAETSLRLRGRLKAETRTFSAGLRWSF